ncbi:4a-hydroxytetrahydrobiopterin dehydratase [Parvicella tangerina]|uniref:4a-hydroxytetrahydrobiopterin dehydratase n=1 Tax=Parvicella tangerina TaxID=2829795 RepID=A0A916JLQ4_9FLAO|nr:4a-hydroxytetrahydrobiopterin dehydratase [Parvicella tangerina]CAG5081396.1 Putative pterin-4-alpha-carbinolamine dehydratase [Parvicella tangerina]
MISWKVKNDYLVKTFELSSFTECVDLLNEVTDIAEELQHHPDVSIKDYKYITFKLRTHDADAVTDQDWQLAKAIDDLQRSLS